MPVMSATPRPIFGVLNGGHGFVNKQGIRSSGRRREGCFNLDFFIDFFMMEPMKEVTPRSIDLSKKLKPFENKWVALSQDHKKVLGVGDTLDKAKREAEKKNKKYIFIKLPAFDVSYVPLEVYEISLRKNSHKRSAKKMDR